MSGEDGPTLEQGGRDAHAAGDYEGAAAAYEHAFAAYRRDGEVLAAARSARTVGWFRGWVFGDWAVHRGWVARARRLLEAADHDLDRARGWVLLDDALSGSDFHEQRRQYLEAIELARRAGDHDLECDATASLGMMLVFSGLLEEGMAHLDEALAAICGGDVAELPVVEGCLCGMLTACERTHDLGRADEWLRAAQRVMQRGNLVSVAGYCRAHYAGILIAAGRWGDADDELTAVLHQLPAGVGVWASARCRLAGLRIQQGRLEAAEKLLVGLDHHDDAVLPLSGLHLARSRPQLALELIERTLAAGVPDYAAGPLWSALADAHLAAGDTDAARQVADRLLALAGEQPAPYIRGLAAAAQGRVRSAVGDPQALPCWREALACYQQSNRTVDAAFASLELARLIAPDRPDAAIAELEAAHLAFEAAGARRGADETAALLRALGGEAKTGPKGHGALTRRESEILDLVSHGLTNAEIAGRLFISPKTVEHHVGRVLTKLGLRSRVEAAAFAARRG